MRTNIQMNVSKPFSFFLTVLLTLSCSQNHAQTTTLSGAKIQLKQLETKINNLRHTLGHMQDKRGKLNQELAIIEKNNSTGVKQLSHIHQEIKSTQNKIEVLQHQVEIQRRQLQTQQQLLTKHLRTRYMIGEDKGLTWLLNHDNPTTTIHLLTLYQYIVQSRQHIISQVHETQKNLGISQEKLHQALIEQQALQEKLFKHQKNLEQDKHYRMAIIQTMNQTIQNKQQALTEFQTNKENLSRILSQLQQQSNTLSQRSLMYMRKKLPKPVEVSANSIRNINQGMIFFAPEGKSVTAVYPGKVVFCDWLKGYGLLLILDHGQGFMTLYAHNQSLYKQKGDFVNQGEQIATVGHSGGLSQNGLYFEIRQRGKAIPPQRWMS